MRAKETIRLIIECDETATAEELLEFLGAALDEGELTATFTWTAESVTTFIPEEIDNE